MEITAEVINHNKSTVNKSQVYIADTILPDIVQLMMFDIF